MSDKPLDKAERGWGMYFQQYFDGQIEVHNAAVNGRSTRDFRTEGRWAKVLEQLHPGDWVFIQFGHNDSKVEDTARYAAPQTAYHQNLTRFVQEARQKGARPVLLTPVGRRYFDEKGQRKDDHGEYPGVVKEVAKLQKVPLIDLHETSWALYAQLGKKGTQPLFWSYQNGAHNTKLDNTHFSAYGAQLVAQGVKKLNLPLAKNLRIGGFDGKYTYELPVVLAPYFEKDTFNIKSYGAVTDGQTLNTEAFRQAIAACAAKGGTVLVPPGLWLTGPIQLKSNVNLHVQRGALVQFTADKSQFDLIKTNWEGVDAVRNESPISGYDLENIAITGAGVFDGAGDAWRMVKKNKLNTTQWQKLVQSGGVLDEKQTTWYPSAQSLQGSTTKEPGILKPGKGVADYADIKDFLRPNMLSLHRCKQVLLEDFTIQNSPAWTIHPLLCQHVTLRRVTAKNPWYGQNTDALDLESCRGGVVESCTFDVGDDGICIKSGRDEQGRLRGVPTEDYYLSEPLRQNDLKGVGPFILASTEMEIAAEDRLGQGKTVGLDYYFNHEFRKNNFTGQPEQFHYTWEDRMHSGFWLWGNEFRELGARTVAVPGAPTAASLKGLSVYIIVDPDTRKETAQPHYIQPADGKAVTDWVRAGGTLVLFANDTANCGIKHFNELAQNFGVRFTDESVNMVQGSQFAQGRVDLASGKSVFKNANAAYIKEVAVLSVQAPAQPLVTNNGKVIMATAKLGKGTVFILGDPWLYNEYTDGRKIPAEYQNFQAGKDLATWLLQQPGR